MHPYTIILADDHVMMREGIRKLIEEEPGLEVIGETGNGLELLKLIQKHTPDLVILDISMPGLQGIEAAHEIQRLHPGVAILILSIHKSEEFVSKALKTGVKGYLLKEDSGAELLQAIDHIRKGRTYLSLKLVNELREDILSICRGNQPFPPDPLSHRERQVIQLIAEGHSDQEIAELLCISIRTVHRHKANIREKLHLKHTAGLVRYAISRGYLSD